MIESILITVAGRAPTVSGISDTLLGWLVLLGAVSVECSGKCVAQSEKLPVRYGVFALSCP